MEFAHAKEVRKSPETPEHNPGSDVPADCVRMRVLLRQTSVCKRRSCYSAVASQSVLPCTVKWPWHANARDVTNTNTMQELMWVISR